MTPSVAVFLEPLQAAASYVSRLMFVNQGAASIVFGSKNKEETKECITSGLML